MGIEGQNPVVPIKRAKEADPELRVAAPFDHFRNPVGFFDSAIRLAAAIPHTDHLAVRAITGLSVGHTHGLKTVRQEGDFVPLAHVASKVDRFDRGQRRGGPKRASFKTREQEGKE